MNDSDFSEEGLYKLFTGVDENDDLVMEWEALTSQVQIFLYRVNQDYSIPFIELAMDIPVYNVEEKTYSDQENFTEIFLNSLRHFLETRFLSQTSGMDQLEIPTFRGFYYDYDDENKINAFALFDMTGMSRSLNHKTCRWEILENIPAPFQSFDLWNLGFQYQKGYLMSLKDIHTRPILVYGTNDQYLRTERPFFGYCFYFRKQKAGEFTVPHYLFLPPEENIFTIQKAELQNISSEALKLYDFSEYPCIHYVENGQLTWCIKNILSFFPVSRD